MCAPARFYFLCLFSKGTRGTWLLKFAFERSVPSHSDTACLGFFSASFRSLLYTCDQGLHISARTRVFLSAYFFPNERRILLFQPRGGFSLSDRFCCFVCGLQLRSFEPPERRVEGGPVTEPSQKVSLRANKRAA